METSKRQQLTSDYIDRVLDNMSTKDLVRIVWEQLEENLEGYSDEELVSEIQDYYPELLDWQLTQYQQHHHETFRLWSSPWLHRIRRAAIR